MSDLHEYFCKLFQNDHKNHKYYNILAHIFIKLPKFWKIVTNSSYRNERKQEVYSNNSIDPL